MAERIRDVRVFVDSQCRAIANDAINNYFKNIHEANYLYYGNGFLRVLKESETDSAGVLKLGINECLPNNLTTDQLTNWLRARVNRLPFLPTE